MSNFTLIDELVDFTNELIELLKQDWEKFKIFIKEYKKYLFWIMVLFITMQFTDLMSLGSSWEKYCKKNNIDSNINSKDSNGKDSNSNIQKGGGNEAPAPAPAPKQTKAERKSIIRQKARQFSRGMGSESKDIERKLGFFRQFKSQFSGNIGGAGPVFGNLDRIFKYTEAMFAIFTTILIIVGVLSLPVLIFLIITYCVIKLLVGKFMIL
jgi:hypothetical protein